MLTIKISLFEKSFINLKYDFEKEMNMTIFRKTYIAHLTMSPCRLCIRLQWIQNVNSPNNSAYEQSLYSSRNSPNKYRVRWTLRSKWTQIARTIRSSWLLIKYITNANRIKWNFPMPKTSLSYWISTFRFFDGLLMKHHFPGSIQNVNMSILYKILLPLVYY